MESVQGFIEASARRSALVARLRGMLEASVPLPPESPATPKSELNFAKGFPQPAKDEPAQPEFWDLLYKELWNPEPDGDGTETNGAQVFVSRVDQADPSADPRELPTTAPEYLYSLWKYDLDETKAGKSVYLGQFRDQYNNANNYDKAGREHLPHLDKAMSFFNEGVLCEHGFPSDHVVHIAPDWRAVALGRDGAYWHYERALAELEDYGEESGGASARYAAQKREMRANIEARMAPIPQRNAEMWLVNVQAAREASEAAVAFDAANDVVAAAEAWKVAEQKWYCAALTRNGRTEGADDADYSGPEGEECKKGMDDAEEKKNAAFDKADKLGIEIP